jgi:hypothetical protein
MMDEAEKLASSLMEYHNRYIHTGNNPIFQTWYRNSYAYYSAILEPDTWETALSFVGEQGELVKMSVPQARSLIRQLVTLITKQRLSFNAIAEVKDRDVIENMRIANALMAENVKNQGLDQKGDQHCETAFVLGTSFLKATWRTDWGVPRVSNDQGGIVYSGDVEVSVIHPIDMIYDYSVQDWSNLDWCEVRTKRNRWSLLQQFPHLEQQIKALPSCYKEGEAMTSWSSPDHDDMVFVFEMYHKPTPAMPSGRMLFYSDDKTIYVDDDNKYLTIPVERMMPEAVMGFGFGYPVLSSLLPAQEMYDHEYSAIATNHSSLGVQNVTVARGADINVIELSGMNFLSYTPQNVPGGGKPEALQLVQTSQEIFKFPDMLLNNMQQIANLNSAVRGELGSNASGVAIATLTTNALEFLNSASKAYVACWEKTMEHVLNAYKRFASVERIVTITGRNSQNYAKSFIGSDLDPIKGVSIQLQNPMMMTMSGRLDIADKLAQGGYIKDMQQYISVLDGAPLNQLVESELSENDLIATENENLQQGKPVQALAIDNHGLHIMRHKCLLNDPNIRLKGQRVEAILNHIMEHVQLAKTTDPMLQAMAQTGQMPQGAAGQPPAPQGPPPEGEPTMPPPEGQPEGSSAQELGLPTAESAQPANDLLERGVE